MRAPARPEHLVHLELLRAASEEAGSDCVQFLDGASATREQLASCALRVAAGLQRAGVVKGDRIAIMLTNRMEFVETWFAAAMLGAIGVPVNISLRGDGLRHVLSQTEPTVVVSEVACLPNLSSAAAAIGSALLVLVDDHGEAGRERAVFGSGSRSYAELVAEDELSSPADVSPWDPFLVMYTSGTTGASKGVVWTHQTALRLAEVAGGAMGYGPNDVVHTTLPLFHGNALVLSAFAALVARAPVAIGHRFSATAFWQEIVACEATTTALLGSMAQILWRQPESPLERQHRLRLALVIPSPPGDQYAAFEARYGLRMTEAYGLTDAGMLVWTPFGERRPGWCGKVAEGWECRVVDSEDRPVPPGTVGEMVARPTEPYIAPLGYWRLPEATVATWRNLWIHTGDLFLQDKDGWFAFVDRSKDAIRRRGENVSSFEVEQVLVSHQAVAECAVYAVPSDLMEDEVMAAVVLEESASVTPEMLIDHCAEHLAYFAVPRYVRFVGGLPRTESEKVVKSELRAAGVNGDVWDREREGYRLVR